MFVDVVSFYILAIICVRIHLPFCYFSSQKASSVCSSDTLWKYNINNTYGVATVVSREIIRNPVPKAMQKADDTIGILEPTRNWFKNIYGHY